ncbi:GAF domain-containing protein [Natrialbaceae archaeon A-gly3]
MNERPDGGRPAISPDGGPSAERAYRSLLAAVEGGVARLDVDGRVVEVDETFREMTGYDRGRLDGEHVSSVMAEGPLEDVVSTLRDRPESVLTLDRPVWTADGRSVPCTWRVAALEGESFAGATVVVRKREDTAVTHRLQYATSRALADASTLEDGLESVLEAVCEWTDWEYGEAWLADVRGVRRLSISYRDDERLAPFAEASEGVRLEVGEGLPGRVYETGDPEWLSDVSSAEGFVRSEIAADVGLKATLSVPVVADGDVIAVLVFAMTERRGVDERLLEAVVSAGTDLGGLIEQLRAKERLERQHEELRTELDEVFDRITDGFYALDASWRFTYVNDRAETFLGKRADRLLGENIWEEFPNDTRREHFERAMETQEPRSFEEYSTTVEAWFDVRVYPSESGLSVYFQDVTERKGYEHELEAKREQLATLNSLNEVVRETTDTIIEQSTREDVEAVVCESLADSASYEFAWIGDVDTDSRTIDLRTEAGVEGFLEDVTISIEPDEPTGQGPTGRAVRTQEMQVTADATSDPEFEPWREHAQEYGYRSVVAIPIVHDDTLYGILGVYADRPAAFGGEEGKVISQLGEVIGHAIAAVERKKALVSDEITELEVQVPDVFEELDVPADHDLITVNRTVFVDDEEYIQYGKTTEGGIDPLEALADRLPHWTELTVISEEFGEVRFESRLSGSPILSIIASHGGELDRATFEDGDLCVSIHLPRGADIRRVVEDLESAYPAVEPIARRQHSRSNEPSRRVRRTWVEELTDRQRTAVEVAYFAGFFEWPRNSSGKEVARTLSITPPTFHQHVRSAENKLFRALFEGKGESS